MADGLCLGGKETICLVNSSVKSDEKLKNIEKPDGVNNVDSVCGPNGPAETQKCATITADKKCVSVVNDTTNNKKLSDGIIMNRFVDKQKAPGLIGLPRNNLKQLKDNIKMSEDTREKRRCTDRYDSSESSDRWDFINNITTRTKKIFFLFRFRSVDKKFIFDGANERAQY